MGLRIKFMVFVSLNVIATKAAYHVPLISAASQTFTVDLYKNLDQDSNILFSPLSLHFILTLLHQGAAGDTAENMQSILDLPDVERAKNGYKQLLEELRSFDDITLDVVNKLFLEKDSKLKDDFYVIARNNFFTDAETIDFTKPAGATKHINDLIKYKTEITDSIKPGDLHKNTKMVLVTANHISGAWLYSFKSSQTTSEPFYISETKSVDCELMNIQGTFRYYNDSYLNAQILQLPLSNQNFRLNIILPRSRTGIKETVGKMEANNLWNMHNNLKLEYVDVSLPKFKIDVTLDLVEILSRTGLHEIFENPDFSNMLVSPLHLPVSKIVQKTYMDVSEYGIDASETLQVDIAGPRVRSESFGVTFKADHPFLFVLSYTDDEEVFVPLLAGQLVKP